MGLSMLITFAIAIYVPVTGAMALFNAVEWLDYDRFSVHPKQTYARRALMSPLWPLGVLLVPVWLVRGTSRGREQHLKAPARGVDR